MIYFTSDLHFCHNKEFIWKERGFNSVEEMNEFIVEQFNQIIKPDDDLYLLGDCCMGQNEDSIPLLAKINGMKHLAIGNHDTDARLVEYRIRNLFGSIEYGGRLKYHNTLFLLSHYPMQVGNSTKEKVWNLHGHTHQRFPLSALPQCYNVGVDAHDCMPVSIEEIYEQIK